ncbi:signal peptidase I [Nocardioides sp. SOB77]|uniref:Signal peptidase I n=1 Tax=Nocardioides oceani TaxID=3058369 RepID=A0ABT8FHM1_9ACTN|nr:signal peptidase I [Nocardioides oceani]MDN4174025.1 signal peptidase I [Nocardioides oceani]
MSTVAPHAATVVGRHRAAAPQRLVVQRSTRSSAPSGQAGQPEPAAGGRRDDRPRGARVRRVLRGLVSLVTSLVLLVCALAFCFLGVGPHLLGYRTSTMLTGSMEPGIAPGDVVVTTPEPVSEVAVGDVISYHIPVENHRVETHRVVEVITNDDGSTAIRTQGDNNENADPWVATLEGDTVWEMQAVVPKLGSVIRVLRSPAVQDGVLWVALGGAILLGMSLIWSDDEDDEELDDDATGEQA